jgi:hypothetical protein
MLEVQSGNGDALAVLFDRYQRHESLVALDCSFSFPAARGLMFARRPYEGVGALKRVRAGNFHLPSVICRRPDDPNPPIPRVIRKRVLDDRNHLRPHLRYRARMMYFHRHRCMGNEDNQDWERNVRPAT